jgi:transcriptional regulator with XRE-family HTH domain
MEWWETVKAAREKIGLNKSELARKAGLEPSHISRLENGDYKSPSIETINKLARALGMTANQLYSGKLPVVRPETPEELLEKLRTASPITVPVFADIPVHAGEPLDYPVDFVYLPPSRKVKEGLAGYHVKGTCLEPIIHDGDVVIVDQNAEINMGDIVLCCSSNELHIGKITKVDGSCYVKNDTGLYKIEECTMSAKVIQSVKYFP